jgi:AraC family ethanolamine operon transcriptional activator
LNASSTLALEHYPNIDAFRISERYARAQSIPIHAGNASILRACLALPRCSLSLVRTFPRLIKGYEIPGRLLAVIPMDDVSSARINGIDIGQSLVLMSGAANCTVHEPEGRLVAILSVRKAALGPDLQTLDGDYLLLELPRERLQALQLLICRFLETAAHDPEAMQTQIVRQATEQLLLAEFEDAIRVAGMVTGDGSGTLSRHCRIVARVDDMLRSNPATRMDVRALAETTGTSARTMHNAVLGVCGLSTYRYLRIRRLWMVRDQLRSGTSGLTVKASALAHGFHHMGEFSETYRKAFGELPSKTLEDALNNASTFDRRE